MAWTYTGAQRNRQVQHLCPHWPILCGVVGFLLLAQPANAQSLFESVQAGLATNPAVEAQRLQISAQIERRIQALSLRRATIQGEASASASKSQRNQQGFNGPSPVRNFDTLPGNISLSMEQPIFTGGRFDAARTIAEIQIRQSEMRLRAAELEVIQGIVTAWADVRRDLAIIAVRKATIEALNELLQGAQERFRLGEATRTQSAQAEARLAGERASLAVAQANLQTSQSNFERYTGMNLVAPGEQGVLPELPRNLEEAIQNARGVNPELLSARLDEDLAKARTREVEADTNGRATVRATVSTDRDQGFQGSRNSSAQIQARYSVPLWTGGAAPSRRREASTQEQVARMRALDFERQTLSRVGAAWARLAANQTSIEASKQQVSAALLALKGARAELFYGIGDQLNVLNQQAEVASAQIALVQSERDALTSYYGLLFAIGSLDGTSFQARPRPSAFEPTSDPAMWEEPLIRVQQKLDPRSRQVERVTRRAIKSIFGPEE